MKTFEEINKKIKADNLNKIIFNRIKRTLDISDSNIYSIWTDKISFYLYIGKIDNDYYFLNYSIMGSIFNIANDIFIMTIENCDMNKEKQLHSRKVLLNTNNSNYDHQIKDANFSLLYTADFNRFYKQFPELFNNEND